MPATFALEELPLNLFRDKSCVNAFAPDSCIITNTPLESLNLKINPLPTPHRDKLNFIIRLGNNLGNLKCDLSIANASVDLGDNISGNVRISMWHDSSLEIGSCSSISQMRVVLDRKCSCSVGSDCLISDGVLLQVGDQHAIFDIETQSIINNCSSTLVIDDHVWLGRDSTILASSDLSIGAGSIVALGALVTRTMPAASLIVGSPAKILREKVGWHRSRLPTIEQINYIALKYS